MTNITKQKLDSIENVIKEMEKAYWTLRQAGFSNIEAEEFLAKRRNWIY